MLPSSSPFFQGRELGSRLFLRVSLAFLTQAGRVLLGLSANAMMPSLRNPAGTSLGSLNERETLADRDAELIILHASNLKCKVNGGLFHTLNASQHPHLICHESGGVVVHLMTHKHAMLVFFFG